MGYRLRRMIRDGASPEWTALMRLVASEIADDARDPDESNSGALPWSAIGVEGHWDEHGAWHDGLAEICGVTPRAISDALTGLARARYEMRRQLGTDKRGKPVYAYRGRAMQFVVPPLAPRKPPERPHSDATFTGSAAPESPHSGAAIEPERSHSRVKRSHQSATPSPQVPSKDQNTDPSDRDRDESRSRPAIADEFLPDVTEELCREMDADGAEASAISGMLEQGAHPQAVRNKISADRFGPRAERRSAAVRCEPHSMPVAVDGSCNMGCPGAWDDTP